MKPIFKRVLSIYAAAALCGCSLPQNTPLPKLTAKAAEAGSIGWMPDGIGTLTVSDGEERMLGDIDGNGRTDFADAEMCMEAVPSGGKSLSEAQFAAADITGYGTVDMRDVLLIRQYYLNNTALGVGYSWEELISKSAQSYSSDAYVSLDSLSFDDVTQAELSFSLNGYSDPQYTKFGGYYISVVLGSGLKPVLDEKQSPVVKEGELCQSGDPLFLYDETKNAVDCLFMTSAGRYDSGDMFSLAVEGDMQDIRKDVLLSDVMLYTSDGSSVEPKSRKLTIAPEVAGEVTKWNDAKSCSCGKNLTWKLDDEGTLTISGTGNMTNYMSGVKPAPWSTEIKAVVIEEGVTSIGSSAFENCAALTSVTISDSVTTIGDSAFSGCNGLKSIAIPDSVTTIGDSAFSDCTSLTSAMIPAGVNSIGNNTFDNCKDLTISGYTGSCAETFANEKNIPFVSISNASETTPTETIVTTTGGTTPGGTVPINTIPDNTTKTTKQTAATAASTTTTAAIETTTTEKNNGTIHVQPASGTCGESLTWTLDSEGTLTISGTGPTRDYSVDEAPFSDMQIQNIVIENGVTSIGQGVFFGCQNLASVIIPNSVVKIDFGAFANCSSLTSVIIPDSVTSIGPAAFIGCKSLTSVVIPDSVTYIDNNAFGACNNLTIKGNAGSAAETYAKENNIPFEVISDAEQTVTTTTAPAAATTTTTTTTTPSAAATAPVTTTAAPATAIVPPSILKSGTWCENLTWTLDSEGTLTISGKGEMPNVVRPMMDYSIIKKVVIEEGVTSICDSAFFYFTSLTSVVIPDSVTSIGGSAFYECTSLTSVSIPDSVTNIGGGAFGGCTNLTAIEVDPANQAYSSQDGVLLSKDKTVLICYPIGNERKEYIIPDSVSDIESSAFAGCENLTSVSISGSVKSISRGMFDGCTSLTSVSIPASVTSIGFLAFSECTSLTAIEVDPANQAYSSLDGVLFSKDKTALEVYPVGNERTEYIIPDSVTTIESHAFAGCENLTSVSISGSVKSIAFAAFMECKNLTSVSIPESVTSIGDTAFGGCTSLTSVTIPDSVTSIGPAAFSNCTSLTSVVIPDSVTRISTSTFSICTSLTTVTIPDSVTSIGDMAFYFCDNLTAITIPDSVTSISSDAFFGCNNLTIKGNAGSYAKTYAKEHNIPFEVIGNAPEITVSGDFNGDKEVTVADAVLLARFVSEDTTVTEEELDKILTAEPDSDGDGLITIRDVAAILKKLGSVQSA